MTKPNKTAFIDTNIFLHFKLFTEIDWTAIIEAGEVKLLIAPIVQRELEKHKYNQKDAILRRRAEKVSARLADIWIEKKPVRPNVNLYFETSEPDEEFNTLHLSRETQDDQLLASIISYRKRNPDETILLVTNDLPLRVKAPQHSVETMTLPDDLRMPPQADPNEKKVRELEQIIRELKSKSPQPAIVFGDNRNYLEFHHIKNEVENDIPDSIEQIKKKYPEMYYPHGAKGDEAMYVDPRGLFSSPMHNPHPDEIQKYNESLNLFYKNYEAYLDELKEWKDFDARTLELKIKLVNNGTAPLEHAVIFMEVTKKNFVIRRDIKLKPEKPSPPEKPKPQSFEFFNQFARMEQSFMRDSLNSLISSAAIKDAANYRPIEPPNIKRNDFNETQDSYAISFEVRKATQGLLYLCPYDLYLVFDSLETASSFKIEYQIIADNLLKPVTGILSVVVR